MNKLIAPLFALFAFAFASPQSHAANYNFITDFGGRGDGVTDNHNQLLKAFNTLQPGDTLNIPAGNYSIVLTSRVIWAPADVVVNGDGAGTVLNLNADKSGDNYREFFRPHGDNFTLSNLTVNRMDGENMVIFPVTPHNGFTVNNCNVNGNVDAYGGYCHAFDIGLGGTLSNFTLHRDTITECSFGVIQSAPGNTNHIAVTDCHFSRNHGDDLGFNNASVFNSTCTDVSVSDCTFSENASTSTSGGFAIAFAHVMDAAVFNCTITDYYNEGIHIEDYCDGIVISHSKLIHVGSGLHAPYCITVSTGSQNVAIDRNTVDARSNTQPNLLMMVAVG